MKSFGYEEMFFGMGVATLFIGMLFLLWNYLREKRANQKQSGLFNSPCQNPCQNKKDSVSRNKRYLDG
jgi:hypothetical protein